MSVDLLRATWGRLRYRFLVSLAVRLWESVPRARPLTIPPVKELPYP